MMVSFDFEIDTADVPNVVDEMQRFMTETEMSITNAMLKVGTRVLPLEEFPEDNGK